jgi:NDP-sugar pyrophosphorylase family protein
MVGMLLAAGRGERMEPLSSLIPKPALPVLDKPLLAASLQQLFAAGCCRVVVNLHRHPEQVAAAARQAACGRQVLFSWEPELLGPGGGLAAARPLFASGPVLVANGDSWAALDLTPLLAAGGPDEVVLGLLPHPDRKRWGAVHLDASGSVVGFSKPGENLQQPGYLYTGWQLLGSATLARLPAPPAPMGAFWEPLVARGALKGVLLSGSFAEAGDPRAYWELVMGLVDGASFVHPQARVHPSCRVVESALGPGAEVAAGAQLERCVLLPGAVVGPGARLRGCLVAGAVPPGRKLSQGVWIGPGAGGAGEAWYPLTG